MSTLANFCGSNCHQHSLFSEGRVFVGMTILALKSDKQIGWMMKNSGNYWQVTAEMSSKYIRR